MEKLEKTLEEWREMLDPEQYNVCRLKGTERPFSGKYNDSKVDGVYHCICCNAPLFDSKTKFDSGCGWPSFYAPIGDSAMVEIRDVSHGMVRTEVVCATCDAHLGHVFPDGPPPTGLRYCINSVCLDLVPARNASPVGAKLAREGAGPVSISVECQDVFASKLRSYR